MLWNTNDQEKQQFQIDQCDPNNEPVIKVPKCAKLQSLGNVNKKSFLATQRACTQNFAIFSAKDQLDDTTFGDWEMKRVEGQKNVFNILITDKRADEQDGCEKRYLSAKKSCAVQFNELAERDDGSGLQKWYLREDEDDDEAYTLTNLGRTDCPRPYVGVNPAGVRLISLRERTGDNALFKIRKGQCKSALDEPIEFAQCNTMTAVAKSDAFTLLTAQRQTCN